eukprot:692165-Hanusia_phi.AAC.10
MSSRSPSPPPPALAASAPADWHGASLHPDLTSRPPSPPLRFSPANHLLSLTPPTPPAKAPWTPFPDELYQPVTSSPITLNMARTLIPLAQLNTLRKLISLTAQKHKQEPDHLVDLACLGLSDHTDAKGDVEMRHLNAVRSMPMNLPLLP